MNIVQFEDVNKLLNVHVPNKHELIQDLILSSSKRRYNAKMQYRKFQMGMQLPWCQGTCLQYAQNLTILLQ